MSANRPPLPTQNALLQGATSSTVVPAGTLGTSLTAYATLVKDDKPVVYYRLNDSSGTRAVDSSGNGHGGVYVGSPGFNHPALIVGDAAAKSTTFTSGYLTEKVTWPQQAITTECWVKPVAADLSGSPRIIGNAWTDNNGNGFMLALDNGRVKFWAGFSSIPTFPLIAGKTYHLVGTYDAYQVPNTTHFYVNDVLVGQNWTQTPHPQFGDSSLTYIGVLNAISPGPGIVDHFQGDVSECAVYNHALTPQQVTAHYNAGVGAAAPVPTPIPATPVPAGTLGTSLTAYATFVKNDRPLVYYRLNDSSGSGATDSSGNGHTGAYVGSPGFSHPALIVGDAAAKSTSFTSGYLTESVTWPQQAITTECWVKPVAADLSGSPRIMGNAWTDNNGNGFMLALDNGQVKFWAGFSSIPTFPLIAGKTYHLVGTYDANEVPNTTHFYVNDVLIGQNWTQTPHPQIGDSTSTYLGVLDALSPGPGIVDHFQGDISDCAIYDHALTPQQVTAHYNAGAGAAAPVPTPIPPTPAPTAPPTPGPLGTPVAYNSSTACVYGKLYNNDVLPAGEGEFGTHGLDRAWWGRYRGDGTQTAQLGNWVSGVATSTWGRTQYNTYFGDSGDGVSTAQDDPFYVGPDTGAPGSPQSLRIRAQPMPSHLVGNPAVHGQPYYAGALMTPVFLPYGFIVARVRTPQPAPGLSPAFWILQGQAVKAGPHGNLSDEWDVQEMFGTDVGDGMNQGELIWNSSSSGPVQNWGGSYSSLPGGGKASSDYHDYGILMNPGGAPISTNYYGSGGPGMTYGDPKTGGTFFLDRQPVYGHTGGADLNLTATTPGYKEIMAMFQVSTGGWLGSPSASNFPADYWLQYIRVYRPTGATCS